MWPFKKKYTYSFTHPKAKGPYIVKAVSEEAAWKKMKSFVISVMCGDWAFFYNHAKVDAILKEVTCQKL